MKARIVKTIVLKELVDTLRDKRTLIAMIGIPLVLYPVLLITTTQVAIVQLNKIEKTPSKVVIEGEDDLLRQWTAAMDMVEIVVSDDPEADLKAGDVDAIVEAKGPLGITLDGLGSAEIEIRFDPTESSSREARDRLEDAFREQDDAIVKERLADQGLDVNFADPLKVEFKNVAPPSKATGMILGAILPLLMVTMLGVGAFYPAVDLTAGEKERGTFETLLSTPASKLEIVTGKFLTVFSLSMITGFLNLGSMVATVLIQLRQVTNAIEQNENSANLDMLSIPPGSIVAMLVILVPLAFFISAIMMSVALFARSFKDAQNYVTPFFMAIILPAGIAALPDVELNATTQFIPISNIALLFRDLMIGKASLDMIFVVFICTVVYALLSLLVAAWIFQREEVILSEEKGFPLTFRRSEYKPSTLPTPGFALGILVIVMLLFFYVGFFVQSKHLQIGLLITEYGLILAPVLLFLWYFRVNIAETLNLRRPTLGAMVGAILMSFSGLLLVLEFGVLQNRVLPVPEEFERLAEELFSIGDTTWSPLILLFVIALSPALCEEVLFRGVLVSGLRQKLSPWATIAVVGVLFGLFHVSIYRFVPTGITGIILTYVVVRTGSIVPAMAGHFVVNATSVLLQTENVPQGVLDFLTERNIDENGLPMWLLALAVVTLLIGAVIVEWSAGTWKSGEHANMGKAKQAPGIVGKE